MWQRKRDKKASEPSQALLVLAGPLVSLSDDPRAQIEYLEGRAQEPDLSDLDVLQELLEEFDDAVELSEAELGLVPGLEAQLASVGDALRTPDLSGDVSALDDPAWQLVRERAEGALRLMRLSGVLKDETAFRLYPVKFAQVLEPVVGDREEWPAIIVSQEQLDAFLARWEAALPSTTPAAEIDVARLQNAARAVYAPYPELIEALGL
ncbi:hypothetical protein [Homoserinibacter sp. GY 40078]|uniref:hypothetical protein n=1 Tax=Homoserinibacter sp. GY 40078 TaxID=2603275 RepID=UPI0011C9600F|nr:hypothetical protein [Homoserinibacter sp. GY 40078]TXK17713.1 hypothetical protein FVQ89_13000 [Homoserinibacter sp. GY 40078]